MSSAHQSRWDPYYAETNKHSVDWVPNTIPKNFSNAKEPSQSTRTAPRFQASRLAMFHPQYCWMTPQPLDESNLQIIYLDDTSVGSITLIIWIFPVLIQESNGKLCDLQWISASNLEFGHSILQTLNPFCTSVVQAMPVGPVSPCRLLIATADWRGHQLSCSHWCNHHTLVYHWFCLDHLLVQRFKNSNTCCSRGTPPRKAISLIQHFFPAEPKFGTWTSGQRGLAVFHPPQPVARPPWSQDHWKPWISKQGVKNQVAEGLELKPSSSASHGASSINETGRNLRK